MSNNWHYVKSGEKHGPITAAQLRELAATGQISPDDLVWREDMKEWRKASTVNGLFPKNAGQVSIKTPPSLPQTIKSSDEAKRRFIWGCLLFPILIALLLPFVQRAREAARKAQAERHIGENQDGSTRAAASLVNGALNVPFDHPLSGVDDATYQSLKEAVRSKDATKIAGALKERDPYSLFSSEELKALKEPVAANSATEPWKGSLVCLSSPPREFKFLAMYWASFHREGENGSYTEVKTVRFEADTRAKQWVVKEIRWVVHDSTLLVIYPYWKDCTRIDKVVCMTPRQVTLDRPGQEDVVPWKREKTTKTLSDYMANVDFSIQFNEDGTFEIGDR